MAEENDRPEDMEIEKEEESESEETTESEEITKTEDVDEESEGFSISNPVGRIFNLRMLRRVVQLVFLLGINGYVFAAWYGQEAITAFWLGFRDILPTLPIIAPLEAPFGVIAGSFDTMQREFTTGFFPFFTIGAMIIILTILGRSACGWVCPIGTIQDFATLPNRSKFRPSPNTEKELRKLKTYIFIIVMFIALWVSVSIAMGTADDLLFALGDLAKSAFAPFNPANILFVIIPAQDWPTSFETLWYLTTWPTIVWMQVVFIGLIVVIGFFFPRWFCRWLCPAGWLYGFFSRDALIGIGRNPARCTPDVCNICEVVCPMNIRIRKFPYQHMHSPDCIMCLDCKSHCPNNAIVLRFS
ncbi:MAG: 4Fe-4S binding protein [Candidatus Thorarchaeota archaeon]